MRREGIPLFTLESWRPVREADLLGITLQAELTYSNVLEVLDLAGIPLRAEERGEDDPIVVAGGPSASNPAPMAPFFDAFFMGESEEAFELVLDAIDAGGRPRGAARGGWPSCPASTCRRRGPRPVERAIYAEFGIETQPTRVVVPYSSAIFSRASVEVMRGLHARLPLLPRRHVVPAGARAPGGRGDQGRDRAALVHRLRRAVADVARNERLHRRDRRDRGDQGASGRICTCRFRRTGSIQGRWP